ncbi:MAG: HugZ family protein [Hyphomicrobiaceae bacterium]
MTVDNKPAKPLRTGASEEDAAIARSIRALVRGALKASLATIDAQTGHPYASLITVTTDPAGQPVFLISRLALHTRNLAADSRASLLFDATDGHANPLAGARATLIGRAHVTTSEAARSRFIARHPGSAGTADFPDFSFWTLAVERAHYIGGFGRIRTLAADMLKGPPASVDLTAAEPTLIEDLNQALTPELQATGQTVPKPEEGAWHVCGLDAEGADLANGLHALRVDFARPATSAEEVHGLLADQLLLRAAQQ